MDSLTIELKFIKPTHNVGGKEHIKVELCKNGKPIERGTQYYETDEGIDKAIEKAALFAFGAMIGWTPNI